MKLRIQCILAELCSFGGEPKAPGETAKERSWRGQGRDRRPIIRGSEWLSEEVDTRENG